MWRLGEACKPLDTGRSADCRRRSRGLAGSMEDTEPLPIHIKSFVRHTLSTGMRLDGALRIDGLP